MATTMYKYRRLARYPLRYWPTLAWIVGLTLAGSVAAALQPWPLKLLVDGALGSADIPVQLKTLLGALALDATPAVLVVSAAFAGLLLFALGTLLETGLGWAWALVGVRMRYDLAADLFARLQRLSLAFHRRQSVGDYLNRITDDASCPHALTSALLVSPVQNLATLVLVGGLAWSLDPELTVLLLTVVPIFGGVAYILGGRLIRLSRRRSEARSRLMAFVQQTLTAIGLTQAFGAEARNREHFHKLANTVVAVVQRGLLVKELGGAANGAAASAGIAIVLFFGGQKVLAGALSLGGLLVFLAYVRLIQGAIRGLIKTYMDLKTVEAQIDRVLEILDTGDEVREAPNAWPVPPRSSGQARQIAIENVTFGYESGKPVLQDVSLVVEPGESVALVGATGAGKTTLVSLIPRFFDPWCGRVLVDGCDVRHVSLASLRTQIGIVLQEPFLFPIAVRDNIAYGRPDAGLDEIAVAAAAANADSFIRRLPQGYDTVLGQRGTTLSAGERQRIGIARAFLINAPILILDEPTSALDAASESLVVEALTRLMKDRTTIIVAHRLSTIRHADRIVVLDNGRVLEMGTHEGLIGARGRYHMLHALQEAGALQEASA